MVMGPSHSRPRGCSSEGRPRCSAVVGGGRENFNYLEAFNTRQKIDHDTRYTVTLYKAAKNADMVRTLVQIGLVSAFL